MSETEEKTELDRGEYVELANGGGVLLRSPTVVDAQRRPPWRPRAQRLAADARSV